MNQQFDIWSTGPGEVYLFTRDWNLARAIKKHKPKCATYMNGRGVFAWQFHLSRKEADLHLLKYKELQRVNLSNFAQDGRP
jgi:hypothetical protein